MRIAYHEGKGKSGGESRGGGRSSQSGLGMSEDSKLWYGTPKSSRFPSFLCPFLPSFLPAVRRSTSDAMTAQHNLGWRWKPRDGSALLSLMASVFCGPFCLIYPKRSKPFPSPFLPYLQLPNWILSLQRKQTPSLSALVLFDTRPSNLSNQSPASVEVITTATWDDDLGPAY